MLLHISIQSQGGSSEKEGLSGVSKNDDTAQD